MDPSQSLKRPLTAQQTEEAHPPQPILPKDSALTEAEKNERNGAHGGLGEGSEEPEPVRKKAKLEGDTPETTESKDDARDKVKGIALIKPEYVFDIAT